MSTSTTYSTDKLIDFDERCADNLEKIKAHQEFWRQALLRNIEIPYDAAYGTTHYVNIAQYLDPDPETGETALDVVGTKKQFARVIKWAHSMGWTVKKEYNDDEFAVRITDIDSLVDHMEFYSTRQVVCKKVQTGTKHVEAIAAHEEPVYEYVCDKVAFLTVED